MAQASAGPSSRLRSFCDFVGVFLHCVYYPCGVELLTVSTVTRCQHEVVPLSVGRPWARSLGLPRRPGWWV